MGDWRVIRLSYKLAVQYVYILVGFWDLCVFVICLGNDNAVINCVCVCGMCVYGPT